MALPILQTPKYTVNLPSTGKTIEYRPFLVKEEKVLLLAQESGSSRDMISAMKDIIKACTFNKVDPNLLTAYDLEFIFLKLRAKSVGETATVNIKCELCETHTPYEINIDEIEVLNVPDKPVEIMLTDTVGVKMRHIRVRDLALLTDEKRKQGDIIVDTVIASIEAIFDQDGVYPTDEASKDELLTFVNSLSRAQMVKIEEFISNTPAIQHTAEFTCSNPDCAHHNTKVIKGAQSFFE